MFIRRMPQALKTIPTSATCRTKLFAQNSLMTQKRPITFLSGTLSLASGALAAVALKEDQVALAVVIFVAGVGAATKLDNHDQKSTKKPR